MPPELAGRLTRFALGIGLSTLRRQGLVESKTEEDWNDNSYLVLSATESGEKWVGTNRARVEQLLEGISPPGQEPELTEDDIPF